VKAKLLLFVLTAWDTEFVWRALQNITRHLYRILNCMFISVLAYGLQFGSNTKYIMCSFLLNRIEVNKRLKINTWGLNLLVLIYLSLDESTRRS
jgi:hypothetical protein